MLEVLTDDEGCGQFDLGLGKIYREGARQMLDEVLEPEAVQDRLRAVNGPHRSRWSAPMRCSTRGCLLSARPRRPREPRSIASPRALGTGPGSRR